MTVSALFADLYELTMAQAYWAQGMNDTAVFEAFFRKLPRERNYVVAAGLEPVVDFLEHLRFTGDDLAYLGSLGSFSAEFLDALRELRFSGELWAVPEGTVVFPHEPIVRVVAPIVEAQLVETLILNQLHLQSVVASKAARVVDAAQGRTVVDFGARRAHGIDAANAAARASYLAGAAGSSNLLAGRLHGIPVYGTMAHSFVQSFARELDAFAAFARVYPDTTLLVDTYDTLRGVDRVIELARQLGERFRVRAVRLDSGDLAALSRQARARLDAAGLGQVRIFASSGLDEHSIAALLAAGSPIDGFGVGTELAMARDAPTLETAYKLVEYAGTGRTKLSSGKVVYPGRKQIVRAQRGGRFTGDTLAQQQERIAGEPLLVPVMRGGRRLPELDLGLDAARSRARAQLAALPAPLRVLSPAEQPYPVSISAGVLAALDELRRDQH